MSFSIFAAGSGNFHFQNNKCVDGSDFDTIKTVAIFQSMSPTKAGAVVSGTEYGLSKVTADITDAVGGIALLEFLHLLKESVDIVAMNSNASDGWISLASKEKNLLWVDTVRFSKYSFFPGDDPGTEFFRAIAKNLNDTNLNNWGVLRALALVISKFSDGLDDSMTPMLNISLTK